jgi:hypothetical protein
VRRFLGLPAFLAQFGRGRTGLTLLYLLLASMNAALPAYVLVGPLLATPEVWRDPVLLALCGLLIALPLLNLLGLGKLISGAADRRATALYQRVRQWDARAPIVFLRAFDQDKAKLKTATIDPFVRVPAGVVRARTLDEILLEHASPYGPVIAIGDPRDPTPPLGAARVFVPEGGDAGWQSVVTSLVDAAEAVVMCPTSSAGVRWELDLLARAEARRRTIFLANPELALEETSALFAQLVGADALAQLRRRQNPLAAYPDGAAWVIVTARRRNVQTYTIALNIALQAMLGDRAEAPARR